MSYCIILYSFQTMDNQVNGTKADLKIKQIASCKQNTVFSFVTILTDCKYATLRKQQINLVHKIIFIIC